MPWPVPTLMHDVKSLTVLVPFIGGSFAILSPKPPHDGSAERNQVSVDTTSSKSFEELKDKLTYAPILVLPCFHKCFR